jgi:hypothetical protein
MGRSYYYFAASLPMISWNTKPSTTVEAFIQAAKRLLNDTDSRLIEQLMNDDPGDIETDNAAAHSWVRFDRNFRNEGAWFRAQRMHKEPHTFIRGTKENDPWLRSIIHEAAKMPDPLDAEMLLDRARWQFLDGLAGGHYFDLEFLISYGLKLKILQRHQTYRSAKGNDTFNEMRAKEIPVDWAVSGI